MTRRILPWRKPLAFPGPKPITTVRAARTTRSALTMIGARTLDAPQARSGR